MNKGARTDADTDSLEEALILSGQNAYSWRIPTKMTMANLANTRKKTHKIGSCSSNDRKCHIVSQGLQLSCWRRTEGGIQGKEEPSRIQHPSQA